jgi:hypothetical protein
MAVERDGIVSKGNYNAMIYSGNLTTSITFDSPIEFMTRVVDDFEEEWFPDASRGKQWDPVTQPKYITPIPTRASLEAEGIAIPKRMA